MDLGQSLAVAREMKNFFKKFEFAEEALQIAATMEGCRGELERARDQSQADLEKAQADVAQVQQELASLKSQVAAEASLLQQARATLTGLQAEVAAEQDRLRTLIDQGAKQVQDGIESATSAMKTKAREEIESINREIAECIAERDQLQSQIDQILGGVKAARKTEGR